MISEIILLISFRIFPSLYFHNYKYFHNMAFLWHQLFPYFASLFYPFVVLGFIIYKLGSIVMEEIAFAINNIVKLFYQCVC